MDGLFNFATPEILRQNYLTERMLNPQQMAQLPLLNQVVAMGGNAGTALGTAVGRAFGGRSPEEARLEQMQGMLGGANMNDPDSLMEVAQRIQSINPAAAQELAQRAMTMRKTQVETQAKEAEMMRLQQGYQMRYEGLKSRHPDMTDEVARSLADEPAAFREAMKSDKVVKETAEGVFVVDKNNPDNKVRIGAPVDRRSVTNVSVSPTLKQAGAVTGLVKSYDDLTQKERESLQSAGTAKTLVNEAMSGNSVAWEGARTVFARAVGEGKLSNEDIRRTGVDPRLVQGTLDWINKKTSGVPTPDIQRQLFAAAGLLEQRAVEKINETSTRTRAVAKLEGVPDDQMDVLFPKINIDRSPRKQPGSGSTVNWSDLK